MNGSRMILRALLGSRLPTHQGKLRLQGLHGRVLIERDRYGIPHIQADNEEDAWFAQGFCQGQDRCFQLEALVRVARGTVSELVGTEGLAVDRISRRVGFARYSRAQFETFDEGVRSQLRAFARGVTYGKTQGLPKRPHELAILRAEPTSFEPTDSIALLALMNFIMPSNWDAELTRLKIVDLDGPEALRDLDRPYPSWLPSTREKSRTEVPVAALYEAARPLLSLLGAAGGSNNWSVAGSKTRSGRPIVANDPHLAPLAPPQWYFVHVKSPEWEIAGASLAGAPGVVSGHNGLAAWGVTAGLIDNTDLCIEELSRDGKSCRGAKGFEPCEVVEERIEVKRGETVIERVTVTPRGPVVAPAMDGCDGADGSPARALSMRATWLVRAPMTGVLELQRARNFEQFRNCFRKWPGLSLNFVFADAKGDVGWQLVGLAPKRPPGTGFVPLPGWKPEFDWKGMEPFDELPHVLNPKEGFVASANAKPTVESRIDLGSDWLDGYRLARIHSELGARGDWDVPSTQKLQLNQFSQPWFEIREQVLPALKTIAAGSRLARPRAILETWDGVVGKDSAGAAIFELLVHELVTRAVKAKAPRASEWLLGRPFSPGLIEVPLYAFRRLGWIVKLLQSKPDGWFKRGWDAEIAEAFGAACAFLEERAGEDPSLWAWGQLRQLEFRHPLGKVPLFRKIFNHGPFPWGGDTNTIGQATNGSPDPLGNPGAIPSMRVVVDVGEWQNSRFALPGGQSGNPASPNYDDMLELWQRGEGVPIAWGESAVKAASVARLELEPSSL